MVFQAIIRGRGFYHSGEFSIPSHCLKPQELRYGFEANDEIEAQRIAEKFITSPQIFDSFCMVEPELVSIGVLTTEAAEEVRRNFPSTVKVVTL